MKKNVYSLALFLVFIAIAPAQEKKLSSTYLIGCWKMNYEKSSQNSKMDIYQPCRCNEKGQKLQFNSNGKYGFINNGKRCGNDRSIKKDCHGGFIYDSKTQKMKIYNLRGLLVSNWKLIRLDNSYNIGITKIDIPTYN